ncbi:MAG TPA: 2-dehydropantoate 2-reductase [Lachnospiraceae bacterium]|nr:2-dehydropantoate 2-reductase [Eubacterium sp.]HBZ03318.1 2-dehydropantoate 2-reductase [Lachnospiraceae bacterium]
MKIYVDFDDCICETARNFSELAVEMFDIHVPYEEIKYFELDKSFNLSGDQFDQFMIRGHEPEVLLSYDETPGASDVIKEWISCGHDVSIITGRPFSSYEPSRQWLDNHGLKNVRLYCLNKYGRDSFIYSDYSLSLEDYYKMEFDFAVEDSPRAFKFFDHLPELKVLVYDRPWNRDIEFANDNYIRCLNWEYIRKCVSEKSF